MFSDAQQFPVVNAFAKGGPHEREMVRDAIRKLAPDLILYGGDAVGFGTYKPFWEEFSRDYRGFTLYPVIGNHDLYGSDETALDYYFSLFPHLDHHRWYDVTFGPVLFVLLDSNRGNMTDAEWDAQSAWLEQELARADASPAVRMVALMSHHPPLSVSSGGGIELVRTTFYERARQHAKFCLYLSGHHHAYQHIVDGKRQVLVAGGGGGPLFFSAGTPLPGDARLVKSAVAQHVVRGVLGENDLRLEVYAFGADNAWALFDVFDIPFGSCAA